MSQESLITTRKASEVLQVHIRTIRNWIIFFQEYIRPETNGKRHLMTPESFMRLKEIKVRLHDSDSAKSMRQVKEELMEEGKIVTNSKTTKETFTEKMDSFEEKITDLCTRLEKMETHMYSLFNIYKYMEHKITTLNNDSLLLEEIKEYLYHIEQNQDDIRGELRNLTVAQQLTSAAAEEVPNRKQKKDRLFRLF